jgi:hypothetical protein
VWYFIVQNGLQAALVFEHDVKADEDRWPGGVARHIASLVEEAGGVQAFDILHLSASGTLGHGGVERTKPWSHSLLRSWGPLQSCMACVITQRGARALLNGLLPISVTNDTYLYEKARTQPSFVLLRPEKRLFEHPVTNFLSSSIGYNVSFHMIPAQYRMLMIGLVVSLLLIVIVALVVRLRMLAKEKQSNKSTDQTGVIK